MSTLEEQVAAAERIAALNPEWTPRASRTYDFVLRHNGGYEVALDPVHGEWEVWDANWGVLREEGRRIMYYASPAEAIRATGLSVVEDVTDE